MVRKKQSREQVGHSRHMGLLGFAVGGPHALAYSGFEGILAATYTGLWALLRPYLFSFNFLFFQQTFVSVFSPLVWSPLLS